MRRIGGRLGPMPLRGVLGPGKFNTYRRSIESVRSECLKLPFEVG